MAECEICGRDAEELFEVNVEGATMLACAKCARGKGVLHRFGGEERKRAASAPSGQMARRAEPDKVEEELVEDYGEVVRRAREALGLPLRVLAERINETESSLARVERSRLPPSDKTRMKLEKELGIRLTAKREARKDSVTQRRDEPISLWDAAKKKGNPNEGA